MELAPELRSKIDIWRRKAIDGTLSDEEMREAIDVLRAGRVAAASASAPKSRAKAKAAVPHADDLLKELGEL